MFECYHTGRRRKWTDEQQDVLRTLTRAENGSTNILLRSVAAIKDLPTINEKTLWPYLRDMNFSCNIYYYILKNTSKGSFWHSHLGNRRVGPAPVPSNRNFYLLTNQVSFQNCSGNRVGCQPVSRSLWSRYRIGNVSMCWVPCRTMASCTGKRSNAQPCVMTQSVFLTDWRRKLIRYSASSWLTMRRFTRESRWTNAGKNGWHRDCSYITCRSTVLSSTVSRYCASRPNISGGTTSA